MIEGRTEYKDGSSGEFCFKHKSIFIKFLNKELGKIKKINIEVKVKRYFLIG